MFSTLFEVLSLNVTEIRSWGELEGWANSVRHQFINPGDRKNEMLGNEERSLVMHYRNDY